MSHRRSRILLIDDDPRYREAVAAALAEHGFDVRCAADGEEGLATFGAHGADVVLLDLELPGIDGAAVCRRLKESVPDDFVPVIVVSGYADTPTRVRLLEGGADDVCPKPFLFPELVARIGVFLRIVCRHERLATERRKFVEFAMTDALTELGNRRAFDAASRREWTRAASTGRPLALLIADLDRFKAVNDRYGHPVGDQVLRAAARLLRAAVREGDECFRFGGEELAVLFPATSLEGALVVAERVRRRVAESDGVPVQITVSIGVAVAPAPELPTLESLIRSADRGLYEAKSAGRDRVVAADPGRSRDRQRVESRP